MLQWQKYLCSWACSTSNTHGAGPCPFLCMPGWWHSSSGTLEQLSWIISWGDAASSKTLHDSSAISFIKHSNILTNTPVYFFAPAYKSIAIKCFILATSPMEVACFDSFQCFASSQSRPCHWSSVCVFEAWHLMSDTWHSHCRTPDLKLFPTLKDQKDKSGCWYTLSEGIPSFCIYKPRWCSGGNYPLALDFLCKELKSHWDASVATIQYLWQLLLCLFVGGSFLVTCFPDSLEPSRLTHCSPRLTLGLTGCLSISASL